MPGTNDARSKHKLANKKPRIAENFELSGTAAGPTFRIRSQAIPPRFVTTKIADIANRALPSKLKIRETLVCAIMLKVYHVDQDLKPLPKLQSTRSS
jgi:hypothetical protein